MHRNILILGWCILLHLYINEMIETTFVRNYILYCTRVILHVSAVYKTSSGISCIKC
jgi:hypothetical protein